MQEKALDQRSQDAEHLRRFLDLSVRKNYPLTSLRKDAFDKEAVLRVFISLCANPQEPKIEEVEAYLCGPAKWLDCSVLEFMSFCREAFVDKKASPLFGSVLQGLIDKRHVQEGERLRIKAFDGERRALERKFISSDDDEPFMREALKQAEIALKNQEVPIGAVVVLEGAIIGRGFNSTVKLTDPTAHAEILAIREASSKVDNYRLNEASLYVTLEPCPMCAGAILNARIKRVVYGVQADEHNRVCGSNFLLKPKKPTDKPFVTSGVLKRECEDLLKKFFLDKRPVPWKEDDIKKS